MTERTSPRRRQAWQNLQTDITGCQTCPRLVQHCRRVAAEKRAAYSGETYWGRPVPNLGEGPAGILIVGLAPGAHGANRTGRMFTGDRSGEWLFRALHRAGLARFPSYQQVNDGQKLLDCAITAVCHCAPPDNKPAPEEIRNCEPFLERTWDLVQPKVVVTLGQLAWSRVFAFAKRQGWWTAAVPRFGHGQLVRVERLAASRRSDSGDFQVLGSFHPSQQNTFTGRLTEKMLDSVFETACRLREESL